MLTYIIYIGIGYLFTYLMVPLSTYIAKKFNIIGDIKIIPKNRKKLPYFGGWALYLGLVFSILLYFVLGINEKELVFNNTKLGGILLGIGFLWFVGTLEDIFRENLNKIIKYIFQLIGAFIIVFWIGNNINLNLGLIKIGNYEFYLIDTIIAVAWILIICNFMNYLETFSGLSISFSIITSLFIAVISLLCRSYDNVFLSLLFVGINLGILWDQLELPTLLLGKSGNYFLGGMLGILSLNINYNNIYYNFMIPLGLYSILLTFGIIVLVNKIKKEKKVENIYIKIIEKKQISLENFVGLLLGITLIVNILSLIISISNIILGVIFFILILIISITQGMYIHKKL